MKVLVIYSKLGEFFRSKGLEAGWGNGYVIVDKSSPLYGKSYDDEIFNEIYVNGGLTFSDSEETFFKKGPGCEYSPKHGPKDGWVFGFDTLHYDDTFAEWQDEASVLREAENLKKQLGALEIELNRLRRAIDSDFLEEPNDR